MTLSPRRTLILALTSFTLLGLAVSSASAQLRGLPTPIVEGATLSDVQRDQIRQFVDSQKANLASNDPLVMKRARAELEQPLSSAQVSIVFRIEYGRHLLPVLEQLAKSDKEVIAANALHLAGELALPLAADFLTRTGLADRRAPVRHAAAFGLKRTFEHLQLNTPVFSDGDAARVISALSRQIASEKDPHVLEGYTRAFEAATGVSQTSLKGVRDAAAMELAKAMGEYARANRDGLNAAPAMIRAAQALRNTVTAPNEPRLPDATLREIAGFGGDLIATVKCQIQAPGNSEIDRDSLAALAASGEGVYYFAHAALGNPSPLNLKLADKVREKRTQDLLQSADQYIGPSGVLTKPPFSLPAKRFECGGGNG